MQASASKTCGQNKSPANSRASSEIDGPLLTALALSSWISGYVSGLASSTHWGRCPLTVATRNLIQTVSYQAYARVIRPSPDLGAAHLTDGLPFAFGYLVKPHCSGGVSCRESKTLAGLLVRNHAATANLYPCQRKILLVELNRIVRNAFVHRGRDNQILIRPALRNRYRFIVEYTLKTIHR